MTAHDQRAVQAGVIRRLLQPLARFYDDDSLFEIIVNKPGELFVEGRQGWTRHEIPEVTLDSLMSFARAVATYSAQKVDATSPVLSATLPDGERIQIVIPPAVPAGTVSVTVRKPSQATFGLAELDAGGLFDEVVATGSELSASDQELGRLYKAKAWHDFLALAVRSRKNILISGATGSGKTTLSKALIAHIPADERIITIEDTPELRDPPAEPRAALLFQGRAGTGPRRREGPSGKLPSHEARPHPPAGASRRYGLLLHSQRELGSSRLDHHRPRRLGDPRLRAIDPAREGERGRTGSRAR